MNNCHIIAFNKELKEVTLNQEMLNATDEQIKNLKYIDSITSRYDEQTFKNHLLKVGKVEDVNTPVCIINEYLDPNQRKNINVYRLINKGPYNKYLENSTDILEVFHKYYDTDKDYKEIANNIITKEEINRINFFNGYSGRSFKLDYFNLRNIVLSLNIYSKYKSYENYPEKDYDYMASKDEILSLLSQQYIL